MPRVAAADVEHVEVGEGGYAADRLVHTPAPSFASRFASRRITDVLVISLAAAHRMLAQL